MKSAVRRWTHGPSFEEGGIRFRLWAPSQERVSLALESRSATIPMERRDGGFFEIFVEGIGAGSLYRFELSDGTRVPDPASRFQPKDVHGPSEMIDHDAYRWRDRRGAAGPGTKSYSTSCTSAPSRRKARSLRRDREARSSGRARRHRASRSCRWRTFRDGATGATTAYCPYAPDSSYGRPEDFKALGRRGASRGMAVLLDVVYNHFGPEGNYLSSYAPNFFTARHRTPWGAAINFDGTNARPVRDFLIHNALYWLDEFHLDGLRLDAVHAIMDDSRPDIVDELARSPPVALRPARSTSCSRTRTTSRSGWSATSASLFSTPRSGTTTSTTCCTSRRRTRTCGYYADYGDTRAPGQGAGRGLRLSGRAHVLSRARRAGSRARTSRRAPSSRSFRTTIRSATARSASG